MLALLATVATASIQSLAPISLPLVATGTPLNLGTALEAPGTTLLVLGTCALQRELNTHANVSRTSRARSRFFHECRPG